MKPLVQEPTKPTLRRYGLTAAEWWGMYDEQGGRCPICLLFPKRFVTDHEHVKGWKKMEPEERRKYVRGLLCWTCNHAVMRRGASVERLNRAAQYLERYEAKRRRLYAVAA